MVKIVDHRFNDDDVYLYLLAYDNIRYCDEWIDLEEMAIRYVDYIEIVNDYFDELENNGNLVV